MNKSFKIGDVVKIKYIENMKFGWNPDMNEYIGNVCKIIEVNRCDDDAYYIYPLHWVPNKSNNWCWSESAFIRLTDEEIMLELL